MTAQDIAVQALRAELERQQALVAENVDTLSRATNLQETATTNLRASTDRLRELRAALDELEPTPEADDAPLEHVEGQPTGVDAEPPAAQL